MASWTLIPSRNGDPPDLTRSAWKLSCLLCTGAASREKRLLVTFSRLIYQNATNVP
jgi:hypothetical protein